jgi:hypothetical protein
MQTNKAFRVIFSGFSQIWKIIWRFYSLHINNQWPGSSAKKDGTAGMENQTNQSLAYPEIRDRSLMRLGNGLQKGIGRKSGYSQIQAFIPPQVLLYHHHQLKVLQSGNP